MTGWEGAGWLMLKGVAGLGIVALNAFFVAAEFALVRVRDTQLQPLEARGSRAAGLARKIVGQIDAYLSTVQLGITFCSLGMGALVEPLFTELLDPVFRGLGFDSLELRRALSFVIGFFINTFVLIAVGELAPKSFALRRAVPIAVFVAYPLWVIYWTCYPLVWALSRTSMWVLRRLGLDDPGKSEAGHTEDELRLMLTAAREHRGGATPAVGRDMVLNALDLRHRQAREVMQPRPEMVVMDTTDTMEAILRLAEEHRYSRFPLCDEGNFDRMQGVVHIKDLYAQRTRARTGADLRAFARPLIYIPEFARLERVLRELLERRLHMAIVVDEYGGTVGLLTLENLLELIVGQIQDEFDQERPLMTTVDERTWELAGNLPLRELAGLTGEPLHHPGVTSVSGWVTQRLGGFPHEGETLPVGAHWSLRVEETQGARVSRLRLSRSAPLTSPQGIHDPTRSV